MKSDPINDVSEPVKQYLEQNLPVLNSDEQRYVLEYLGKHEEANLEELANELSGELNQGEIGFKARLYHFDLPQLEEYGLAKYESQEEYVELSELGVELAEWMQELGMREEIIED